jgi:hypothetical protein
LLSEACTSANSESLPPMNSRKRQGRALFLAFICASMIAVLMAAPLLSSLDNASVGGSHVVKSGLAKSAAKK